MPAVQEIVRSSRSDPARGWMAWASAGDREVWLARTLVAMTDTVADDFDIHRFACEVAGRFAQLLDGAEVGVTVAGPVAVTATTTDRVTAFQDFGTLKGEGPGVQAARTGEQVVNVGPEDAAQAWPSLTALARAAGLGSINAIPLRHRGEVIGAITCYCPNGRVLSREEIDVAQTIADAASIGIVQARALEDSRNLNSQLQRALDSRIVIEQAKGVLAERLAISVDKAFALIRRHARSHNERLESVATAVLAGSTQIPELSMAS